MLKKEHAGHASTGEAKDVKAVKANQCIAIGKRKSNERKDNE